MCCIYTYVIILSLLYILTDIESDFNEVFQTTSKFSANWEDIGSRLGITKYTIDIIARNNGNDVTKCMSNMIEKWLKRETPEQPLPTWSHLCNAIASVDLSAAERIAAERIAADKGLDIKPTGRIYL